MYIDDLKLTIMNMIQNTFPDIKVTDTPIESKIDKKNNYPFLLYKNSLNKNNTLIQVIDRDKYIDFGIEEIPKLENVKGMKIIYNNIENEILDYNNDTGTLKLKNSCNNLLPYSDYFIVNGNDTSNKNFILINVPYNYSDTLNYNTIIYYRRFNLDIFIYDDVNNNMVEYYTNKLHNLFARDFKILNSKEIVYIESQLTFDMSEYNISNKIIRGSMLIKRIKERCK